MYNVDWIKHPSIKTDNKGKRNVSHILHCLVYTYLIIGISVAYYVQIFIK